MLDTERAYFARNAEDLIKRFPDRYVIVRGEEILGDYRTYHEALACATNAFYLDTGTFLIRHCRPPRRVRAAPAPRRRAS